MIETPRIVLINTGGTFNKIYDPLTGTLPVADDDSAVLRSLSSATTNLEIHRIDLMHKDSLEMTATDRAALVSAIRACPHDWADAPVLIVHGTDTMDQTANALERADLGRVVVLTGSMRPVSIEPVEGALHLGLALGFLQTAPAPGIFIAMHGLVLPHGAIEKDRAQGVFRPRGARH